MLREAKPHGPVGLRKRQHLKNYHSAVGSGAQASRQAPGSHTHVHSGQQRCGLKTFPGPSIPFPTELIPENTLVLPWRAVLFSKSTSIPRVLMREDAMDVPSSRRKGLRGLGYAGPSQCHSAKASAGEVEGGRAGATCGGREGIADQR